MPRQYSLVVALVCASGVAVAAPMRWRTIETAHFRIHAYDAEMALALRVAAIAEKAHGQLTRALRWVPGGRIDITMVDDTDRANGLAAVVPRNIIYANVTPPESLSTLNDFDDWLTVLITHELTHVVHLDITLGLGRVINLLSGKIFAPNQAQPVWFIEGLAMLEESAQTTGGRERNAIVDMYLRMATLDGTLLDLDAVSNGPQSFPFGVAPYVYGAAFLQYVSDRFGPDRLAEIGHRYGNNVIPFALNRTARESLGVGYDDLWRDWQTALGHRYRLQADEVERRGPTVGRRVTFDGEGAAGSLAPRFLPDGRVLYQLSGSYRRPGYVVLDPATGKRDTLVELNAAGQATPTPDGKGIVFQQVNLQRLPRRIAGSAYGEWDDLFRMDLATRRIGPLTRGLRLHEPEVSPDGTRIACTQTRPGAIDLVVLPASGGTPTILGPTGGLDAAYTPSWSPDGARIAYSRWKPGGYRDIHIHDLGDGSDRPLWIDRAVDANPRFTPDARFVLLSSDRTGIYNIYAYELATRMLFEVTNVLGGAFQPVVSPDARTLLYVGFSAQGFDLFAMPYDPASWRPAPPVLSEREDAAPPADAPTAGVVQRVTDYQPWKHMYPRRWDLTAASNPLGLGSSVGLATVVNDPVSEHDLFLGADVPLSSPASGASVRLDYTYAGLWPALNLTVARAAYLSSGLVVDQRGYTFRERSLSGSTSVSLPIVRTTESSASLSFGYNVYDYRPLDAFPAASPTGGIIHPAETGPVASISAGFAFNNVKQWTYSISGQEGRSIDLTFERSDAHLGSRFQTTLLGGSWTEYFTPPWARLQALAVAYHGGISFGDKPRVYGLGGFVEQDVVRAFFLNRHQCCLFLRGYPPGAVSGDQFHLLSAEYRAPLIRIEKGVGTFPLYLRRLHGALYADAGNAFFGSFDPRGIRYGVGIDLRLNFTVGYRVESTLSLGIARGLSEGGMTDYYLVSAFPF